jgi:hypothetical protein
MKSIDKAFENEMEGTTSMENGVVQKDGYIYDENTKYLKKLSKTDDIVDEEGYEYAEAHWSEEYDAWELRVETDNQGFASRLVHPLSGDTVVDLKDENVEQDLTILANKHHSVVEISNMIELNDSTQSFYLRGDKVIIPTDEEDEETDESINDYNMVLYNVVFLSVLLTGLLSFQHIAIKAILVGGIALGLLNIYKLLNNNNSSSDEEEKEPTYTSINLNYTLPKQSSYAYRYEPDVDCEHWKIYEKMKEKYDYDCQDNGSYYLFGNEDALENMITKKFRIYEG